MPKVLIADQLSPAAVAIFKDRGVEADTKTGLSKDELLKIIGDKRAAFLRAHGITVVGRNLRELLHATLALENDARKTLEAEAMGGIGTLSAEECRIINQEIRLETIAQRTWTYFSLLEARWDRQPASGRMDLFP